ncbi:AI-2E family transporter [Peredibacter starrii]|uniref:AI-2E family transporter n=1 Tax=Peredibacter starrii TaxID=28202 RepID=A0AAX4HJE7_9BACT|nr:AI-2E family transporter [Peredibacter starrii]WPU63345.1 AI-2E family transporter [Peredibacter starrii]
MLNKTENKVVRILYIVALTIACAVLVSPFYIPIIFGASLSLALYPLQLKLESKGLTRNRAAAIITTFFTIIISIPVLFFLVKGTIAVTQQLEKMSLQDRLKDQGVQELVMDLRQEIINIVHKFSARYSFMDFLTVKKIDTYLVTVNNYLLGFFQDLASGLPLIFMFLLIMVLCIYSFLTHADGVRKFFKALLGFEDERMNQIIKVFIRNSRQVYLSNIVTGGIQSLIVALAVSLLNQGDFFLVFFVTLILSFIPVIGAAPVAFLFGLVAFFRDNTTAAIILAVVGVFTGVVDNILRPWLASFGESKIPAVVAFICVLGGAILLGFPGLFIGLLIGSIAYDSFPIFWEEIGKDR